MSTLEILMQARAKIAKGWCRGSLNKNDSYCAWGAIAYTDPDVEGAGREPLLALARIILGDGELICPGGIIARWNDHPKRTQAEVLALFDRVIEDEWQKVGTAEPSRPELVVA